MLVGLRNAGRKRGGRQELVTVLNLHFLQLGTDLFDALLGVEQRIEQIRACLLYTSDAADE